MVVVFDVDGTLIDGKERDLHCLNQAIEQVAGLDADETFWRTIEEFTGRAIVREVARLINMDYSEDFETRIRRQYLANLRKECPHKGEVFVPRPGVKEFLELLRSSPVFGIAIATGEFSEVSRFKLASSGTDIRGIPFATGSDEERRKDIINLAVKKAGYDISDAVYVGDGLWDLKACEQLGIPFIGTGICLDKLREAGAEYLVSDLFPETILPVINTILGA